MAKDLDPASTTTFRAFSHSLANPSLANALRVFMGIPPNDAALDEPRSTSVINDALKELLTKKEVKGNA